MSARPASGPSRAAVEHVRRAREKNGALVPPQTKGNMNTNARPARATPVAGSLDASAKGYQRLKEQTGIVPAVLQRAGVGPDASAEHAINTVKRAAGESAWSKAAACDGTLARANILLDAMSARAPKPAARAEPSVYPWRAAAGLTRADDHRIARKAAADDGAEDDDASDNDKCKCGHVRASHARGEGCLEKKCDCEAFTDASEDSAPESTREAARAPKASAQREASIANLMQITGLPREQVAASYDATVAQTGMSAEQFAGVHAREFPAAKVSASQREASIENLTRITGFPRDQVAASYDAATLGGRAPAQAPAKVSASQREASITQITRITGFPRDQVAASYDASFGGAK